MFGFLRPSLRRLGVAGLAFAAVAFSTLPSKAYVEQFGVYGTRWAPWMTLNPHLAGFFIHQAPSNYLRDLDYDVIQDLSSKGVEIIVMQGIHKSYIERFMRKGSKPDRAPRAVAEKLVRMYDNPAMNSIRVMTLDEENFWWNGRGEYLAEVYREVKARMPERQLWQWFNDNQRRRAPIEDRFSIPADGYIADMYSVPMDEYEDRLLRYLSEGKPVINTVWASPNWRHGQRRLGRQTEWWDSEGWRSFYTKVMINRRHNVRIALFMADIPFNGPPSGLMTMGFESEDPCIRAFTKKLFTVTLPQLGTISPNAPIPARRPEWMAERCPAN